MPKRHPSARPRGTSTVAAACSGAGRQCATNLASYRGQYTRSPCMNCIQQLRQAAGYYRSTAPESRLAQRWARSSTSTVYISHCHIQPVHSPTAPRFADSQKGWAHAAGCPWGHATGWSPPPRGPLTRTALHLPRLLPPPPLLLTLRAHPTPAAAAAAGVHAGARARRASAAVGLRWCRYSSWSCHCCTAADAVVGVVGPGGGTGACVAVPLPQ